MKTCTQSKSTVLGSINISYKKKERKKERTVRGRKEKREKGGEEETKEKWEEKMGRRGKYLLNAAWT